MNHNRSSELFSESCKYTPGGVSSPVRAFGPFPIFASSGKGCMISDVDGNDYIDMCMAYGPLILGHSDPRVISEVTSVLRDGTVYGMPSEAETGLMKRICSRVPCADMVRLTNSGTESTMHAVRLARGYTGKDEVVKIDGGFHGAHDTLLVNGSSKKIVSSRGVPVGATSGTHSIPFNDVGALEELLENDQNIACMIVEPIMANMGVIPPEKGYLNAVRKMTDEHGVVLIFDEVVTGFRVSEGSAQGLYGIRPDLCTLGKIIGGGFPVGAITGRSKIMECLAPAGDVYEAGTFSGNPITCTAGSVTIDVMGKDGYVQLKKCTDIIVRSFTDSLNDTGTRGCINSSISMFQIFFGCDAVKNSEDARTADKKMFDRMFRFMLNSGIYIPHSPFETNFFSVSHDEGAITKLSETFNEFLRGDRK